MSVVFLEVESIVCYTRWPTVLVNTDTGQSRIACCLEAIAMDDYITSKWSTIDQIHITLVVVAGPQEIASFNPTLAAVQDNNSQIDKPDSTQSDRVTDYHSAYGYNRTEI